MEKQTHRESEERLEKFVDESGRFPDWRRLYREADVEWMPWFHPALDADLKEAIDTLGIKRGRFLDIGTGPGNQAAHLAKLGFQVMGIDIAPAAIDRAHSLYPSVTFVVDDILSTHLQGHFDFAFDRGCFHIFSPEERKNYLRNAARLIKHEGILFLKCFSNDEPERENGPYRYSSNEIEALFSSDFTLESIHDTVYQGSLEPPPRALFSILRRN